MQLHEERQKKKVCTLLEEEEAGSIEKRGNSLKREKLAQPTRFFKARS